MVFTVLYCPKVVERGKRERFLTVPSPTGKKSDKGGEGEKGE